MTLIDKAQIGRDGGDGVATPQPASRLLEPDLQVIGVHGKTEGTLKLASELESTQASDSRQVGGGDGFLEPIVKVVASLMKRIERENRAGLPPLHVSARQTPDDTLETLLGLE
jgi:hypothetical protein